MFKGQDQPPCLGLFLTCCYKIYYSLMQTRVKSANTFCSKDRLKTMSMQIRVFKLSLEQKIFTDLSLSLC